LHPAVAFLNLNKKAIKFYLLFLQLSMLRLSTKELNPEERFVLLAMELQRTFPELDLRFNLLDGSTTARCLIPELSEEALELSLNGRELSKTLHEAIFSIKQLAHLFDA
jgi:hypothetical protein